MNKLSPPVILCVDDEVVGLSTRKAVLELSGYSVLTATNADEALAQFKANRVDLVLTDHLLAESSGTALAAEMKRLKPEVPVAVLSGGAPDDLQYVDGFIMKGTAVPEMLSYIAALLESAPLHRSILEIQER